MKKVIDLNTARKIKEMCKSWKERRDERIQSFEKELNLKFNKSKENGWIEVNRFYD